MTTAPMPGRVPGSGVGHHPYTPMALWAIRFAVAFGVVVAAGIPLVVVTGGGGGLVFVLSTLTSIVASVMTLLAWRGERWTLLWLPLLAFPAWLLLCVVLVVSGVAP